MVDKLAVLAAKKLPEMFGHVTMTSSFVISIIN